MMCLLKAQAPLMSFAALNAQALSSQVDSDWLSMFLSTGKNHFESDSHYSYHLSLFL